jgi:CheY-like chemotaxis protein
MNFRLHTEVVPLSEIEGIPQFDSALPVVLVVDDEPIVADTLAAILAKSGFSALKAYSARAALALAHVTPPALLLTDVQMPGMSGVELALELIREWPECQVLLFSGHATPRDLEVATSIGYHFPLLCKPLHPSQLLEEISASLGFVS